MATKYTSKKAPGLTVTVKQSGVYIQLSDGEIRVEPPRPADVIEVVLNQFHVMDQTISWDDLDSESTTG